MHPKSKSTTDRHTVIRWLSLAIIVLALAVGVTACGGGGDSGSTSTESTSEGTGSTEATSETDGGNDSIAAAKKAIAPYVGQPSEFPVTEPLNEIPKGATVAYTDNGDPVAALISGLLQEAAETMGINFSRVKTGSDAQSFIAGLETIIQTEPDGVILAVAELEQLQKQIGELEDKNIAIATTGIAGAEEAGFEAVQSGTHQNELAGKLMADYVAAEMNPEANIAIYEVPELSFSPQISEAFQEELESVCPECSVHTTRISVTEIGSTAPNKIVSDLQANPETNLALFTLDGLQAGLPTALHSAGIEVETLGYNPGPENLQYLKEGKETAVLAFDLPVSDWTLIDMQAREIIGQPLTGPSAEGLTDLQFLTKEDITFDPSKGWTGYPDYEERFKKLWGVD